MTTEDPELIADSSKPGEYDPNNPYGRWNAMASLSTSTDLSQWDSSAYMKRLDSGDASELYMSAEWEAGEEDAIDAEVDEIESVGYAEEEVDEELLEQVEEEAEEEAEEEEVEYEEEGGEEVDEEVDESAAIEEEEPAGDNEKMYLRFQTAQSNLFPEDRETLVRYNSEEFQRDSRPVEVIKQPDDQETESSTPVELPSSVAVSDDTRPCSISHIDSQISIRYVNGKGRCCFAKRDFRPGDVIFAELPTLSATPALDPPLWEDLTMLNKEEPFDLPPIWHLAALYSLTQLSKPQQQIIMDKWVADENRPPGKDVNRVLNHTRLAVDPRRYERFLQVWRYNSFGHHAVTEGLVLYNRISMLAHDCAATACWHYGDQDAFVLRARQLIRKGEEITISYVGDEDLFKSTNIRQDKLAGWLFKCSCRRCTSDIDSSRGFRCPTCGAGVVFFKTEKDPNSSEPGVTTASRCSLCRSKTEDVTIAQYLEFEAAYIARLDDTDKNDLADAEAVYSEAQRVFNQHWVLFALDGILFDAYRERKCWIDAATHQTNRIQFASQVIPHASYTLAWLYEERGDALSNACPDDENLSGFLRNLISFSYETAMNMLIILSGWRHQYTVAAGQKLARYHPSSP